MPIDVGTTLSHYRIEARLGEGGMGEVYLAEDTALDRTVALKILPPDQASVREHMQRFVQEAKAASAINHPNVAHIYEIGESNSASFIAMEYIDGQTLDSRIKSRQLSLPEIIEIGVQVADALDVAHSKGVIHRDIKPANIMITPRGQVKVLDFGIAKFSRTEEDLLFSHDATTQAITKPGVVMGTVYYMSPEQSMGRSLDARTDIFSLGVVLYEMATGKRPFAGARAIETIDQIVHTNPEPITALNQTLPTQLERIISRCLEKDRERRYQSAHDLLADLRRLRHQSQSSARTAEFVSVRTDTTETPKFTRSRRNTIVATLIGLAVLAVAGYFLVASREPAMDSVAVLPFANVGGDPGAEFLSDGITESIINSLSQLSGLKVMSRGSVFRYKGREVDLQNVARELRVRALLTGKVAQRGDTLIISAELVDARYNRQIWGEQYTRKLADILQVQEEIARDISENLRLRLTGDDQKKLTRRYTDNSEAYQLYIKGRFYWNKRTDEGYERAIDHFKRAIEVDPNYALAYAGLGDSYIFINTSSLPRSEAMPLAADAARKALHIDDGLSEAHTSLARVHMYLDFNWSAAESEFKRAIELNDSYPTAHQWYAELLSARGELARAEAEIKRAQELDPLSLTISNAVGVISYFGRRYDFAADQFRKTLEMDNNFARAHTWLAQTHTEKSQFAQASAELDKASALVGHNNSLVVPELGRLYAVSGRRAEAIKVLEQMQELGKIRDVSEYAVALIYASLGEHERAFEWMDKALETKDGHLVHLKVDPRLDMLRTDPRFQELLRRVGLD
jgi:serine/threonine-protein kinase